MIGNKITAFNSLDSTSNYIAKQLILGTYADGDVILAHFQTEGRGQRGSFWQSNADKNLTFSFAVPLNFTGIHQNFIISKAVSLAIYNMLSTYFSSDVFIKWPNDILISESKICGILIETKRVKSQQYIIIGIGLNVNQTDFENDVKATSIALQLGESVNVESVLQDLIKELNACVIPVLESRFEQIENHYMKALYGSNQWIKFSESDRSYYGQISEVDNEGVMLVKSKQGGTKSYRTKEVKIHY